VFDAYTTFNRI